jgi:hypothetical protein
MKPPKSLPIALVLAALALAGCGGGSSTASTPTTTETTAAPSKAELIKQGDAICAEVNSAVGAVGSTEASVPSQVSQVADLYTGMVASLRRLGVPENTAGYAEFMKAAEELAKVEGEAKLAAERKDTAALGEAATKATPALEEFETQAGVYGFEKCSEGPHAPTTSSAGAGAGAGAGGEEAAEGSPEAIEEEAAPEAEEEPAPETGGAGGAGEGAAPEGGGTGAGGGGGETGGSSGGIGPG